MARVVSRCNHARSFELRIGFEETKAPQPNSVGEYVCEAGAQTYNDVVNRRWETRKGVVDHTPLLIPSKRGCAFLGRPQSRHGRVCQNFVAEPQKAIKTLRMRRT